MPVDILLNPFHLNLRQSIKSALGNSAPAVYSTIDIQSFRADINGALIKFNLIHLDLLPAEKKSLRHFFS